MPYMYEQVSKRFMCFREPMIGETDIPFSTDIAPPPEIPQTVRCFDEETNTWIYYEWWPSPGQPDTFCDILTYADLRKLEYPAMEELLDGMAKGDTEQQQRYFDACLVVKARWPKDMEPITRREYLQRTIGLVCNL